MEICDQSLACESFSYSWFVDKPPPLYNDLDEYLRPSSPRDTNFIFDTSVSKRSSLNLVHADEIFSNGHLIPKYIRSKKEEALSSSDSVPFTPISPFSSTTIYQENGSTYCRCIKKWRKSSKQMVHKFFEVFLRPFCQKVGIGCPRKSIRVDEMNRKVLEVQSQGNSLHASPQRINDPFDYGRLRKVKSWSDMPREYASQSPSTSTNGFCDIAISEAVLYCKRSIEN